MDDKSVTLDDKDTYDISKAKVDISADEAIGQKLAIEYTDGTKDAVHVYLSPENDKAVGAEDSSSGMGGAAKAAIILALIAIAIAIVIVVMRNRRKPEVK